MQSSSENDHFDSPRPISNGVNRPKAALFDLDDTLAESFKPPSEEILSKLKALIARIPVAIITAAGMPRIQHDFLVPLAGVPGIEHFYLFPNSSSECYIYKNSDWAQEYSLTLTLEDREKIKKAIREVIAQKHIDPVPGYEPLIVDREAQVAYAFLGFDAPDEVKRAWDQSGEKRMKVQAALMEMLPEYDVLVGGRSTIDITRQGVNKAYGVQWLAKHLGCDPSEMYYVADALYPGGNDYVVIPTGIQTRSVAGPSETALVLDELLLSCGA